MIGLATQVFDLLGAVLLVRTDAESETSAVGRRVSRTATLDGGAVITDGGCAPADKTLKVVAQQIDEATFAAVKYLVENYSQIMVSTRDGLFVGALENLTLDGDRLLLTVLVTAEIGG
jgi:hypothetical protein